MFAALSVLLLIGCLLPGAAKLAGHPRMRESARHFRITWRRYRLIGVAELAAAAGVLAGLWWHPLGAGGRRRDGVPNGRRPDHAQASG